MDTDQVMDKLQELKEEKQENTAAEKTVPAEYAADIVPPVAGYGQTIMPPPIPTRKVAPRPLSPLSRKLRDNYPFFGKTVLGYALFYTFCLYKNISGITAPLFAAGTLVCFFLWLRRLEIGIKKENIFYAGGILLLGVNLCLTDDIFLVLCDHLGMFLLLISGLLHQFYADKDWGLPGYMNAILQAVFGALENLPRPLEDRKIWKRDHSDQKKRKGNGKLKYVVIGILAGLPILAVVLVLLSSADPMFDRVFMDVYAFFSIEQLLDHMGDVVYIIFMIIAVFFAVYGILAKLASDSVRVYSTNRRTGEPVIAITVGSMLGVVYLVFSVIQILYLFLRKFELPAEYTYAAYARQGFFQLLAVCIINMVLVLICIYFFRESKALKAILVLISGCTYIMIASSALRMYMYVEAYDLSYLRVLVFWGLGLIFFVMSGIMIYIFRQKFPLFTYCMVVVTILYLGLAYARPEYMIASYNLSEKHTSGYVDYRYLNRLSTDAYPAIEAAIEREHNEEFTGKFDHFMASNVYVRKQDSIREYNFSRAYMRSHVD